MNEQYKPGEIVPDSGIYKVIHDKNSKHEEHQVTCIKGKKFPPCNNCGNQVKFELIQKTIHIEDHEYFKIKPGTWK